MYKLTRTLMAAVAVAAIVAAPASAARKTHRYSSTVVSAPLSTGNGYPGVGGTAVFAGTVETAAFGDGALVDRVTISGRPQPNVIAFKGTEVDFYADGSAKSTFTGTSTVNADGSQDVVVKGRFKGGTGRYKRASGSYRFTGSTPSGSTLLSGTGRGSLVF